MPTSPNSIPVEEITSNSIHDARAVSYGYNIDESLASRLKYDLARKHLHPEFTVLDVGCANGIHMHALAGFCSEITGIDIHDKMLELARAKLSEENIANATLLKQNATQLNFEDARFDLVYSFSTLLLISDIHRAIEQIVRVLKPGGIAILDITGRFNLSRLYWAKRYRAKGHFGINAFSYKEIRVFLKHLGMEILEEHALGFADQWKYIPLLNQVLNRFLPLDRWLHHSREQDIDYKLSNSTLLRPLANRWYIVSRKPIPQ